MKLTQFELKKMKVGDLFANKRVEGGVSAPVSILHGVYLSILQGVYLN